MKKKVKLIKKLSSALIIIIPLVVIPLYTGEHQVLCESDPFEIYDMYSIISPLQNSPYNTSL